MVDRYDKSLSGRPAANDPASNRAGLRPSQQEDPLAELARIVSGNQSFDDIVGGRQPASPQRQPQPTVRPASRDASFDLESELLNDLQSSFDPAARSAPRQPSSEPPFARPAGREAPRETFQDMRLRPTQAAAPSWTSPREPEPPVEDDDPYSGTAYAGSQDYGQPSNPELASARAFGRARSDQDYADEGPAPGYDDYVEDDLDPAYAEGDYGDDRFTEYDGYEPERPRRSRKVLITAAIVLAVLLVGGLAALALKDRSTTGTGAPRVIAADDGPTKVEPAVQPVEADGQQNKLIYDRADPDVSTQEQLVLPDDGALDSAPAVNESAGSREISRIILPGAPGDPSNSPAVPDAGAPAMAPDAAAPSADDDGDSAPRKVRTVVIKPDGTIVSSEAKAQNAPASGDGAAASAPAIPMTPPNPDVALPGAVAAATPPPQEAVPVIPAPVDEAPVADSAPEPAKPQKDPSQMAEPRVAAATRPAARPATSETAAPSSGGFVVQVTSQRTEEQAVSAFRSLQRKFPDILGSRSPDIARADLGAKGIYYRARVGPMGTRDEAISFCEALKASGGDCIVQKN